MDELATQYVQQRIAVEDLMAFSIAVMRAFHISEEHARQTAEVLVAADTWGTHSHGTRQLVPLMHNVVHNALRASAEPQIIKEGSGFVLVDGNFALPMVTSRFAMHQAMEKARTAGIAYAAVQHSGHYGAAGYYALMAAEENMIGISMSNVDVCMTVPGARAPVMGTNPLAYAVPAGQEQPVFLDIATSVVAISKVIAAKTAGQPIPEGWLVDAEGNPTTDTTAYPDQGSILPMAGHKGYGIALLIEILSGVLTGAAFLSGINGWLKPEPKPADEGHSFIAINVETLMPLAQFQERMDRMIQEVRSAPRAAGADRIYLPGEMELERREIALREGITLPDYVLSNLFKVAAEANLTAQLQSMFFTA
jgi:ureidoglycolate dehydrogenase (NAD+)